MPRKRYSRYEEAFPAEPGAVRTIRDDMAAIAGECGLTDTQIGDVKLAVSEAATNAIVHGSSEAGATVRVAAFYERHELMIHISDDGDGMVPRLDSPGAGLGLPVIAAIAKRLDVKQDGGTTIEMVFDCPAGVSRPA